MNLKIKDIKINFACLQIKNCAEVLGGTDI